MSSLARLQQIGIISLASLTFGGILLILVGINSLSTRSERFGHVAQNSSQNAFWIGWRLSVQAWLAILGFDFGLLSYGFTESYLHIFDLWATRQLEHKSGLNYARYLNSQPRAPILFGMRGFTRFIALRYVITLLGFVASVGYKFSVVEVTILSLEAFSNDQVELRVPPFHGMDNGTTSPWVGDAPLSPYNRAFLHQQITYGASPRLEDHNNYQQPALSIAMVGWASCPAVFHPQDDGHIVTREVILVANMTDEVGDFYMTAADIGWVRVDRTGMRNWLRQNGEQYPAVVDYRIVKPGKIEMQWADRNGNWTVDQSLKQRVERRVSYEVRYAVAEVTRRVSAGDCSFLLDDFGDLSGVHILATKAEEIKTENIDGSLHFSYTGFVNAILLSDEAGPREGVSAFVRAAMTGWGVEINRRNDFLKLGHAPSSELFGPEDSSVTSRAKQLVPLEYPYYNGTRAAKSTGSYAAVAIVFLFIGVFSIAVAVARVCFGPPALTSWMGQHVYLGSVYLVATGAVRGYGVEELASGYEPAMERVGRLRQIRIPVMATAWEGGGLR